MVVLGFAATVAQSQPVNPTYFQTVQDAITKDNAFIHSGDRYWDIDAGADSYQNDYYERPTVQSYNYRGAKYGASEYFEYIDIDKARYGWDNRFFYVSIDLMGRNKSTSDGNNSPEGLFSRYGFRMARDVNGRNGSLFVVDSPESVGLGGWTLQKSFGHRDTNNDVGGRGLFLGGPTGRSVTKQDNPNEEIGMDGYDQDFVFDGRLFGSTPVLWSRIKPGDNTVVEMALDYSALSMSVNDLLAMQYLEFEAIKGDPKDPRKYLWNDKYIKSEAGSPYGGANDLSEFGTQGLINIYELDTLRGGGVVPEPATMAALGLGVVAMIRKHRKRT